MRTGFYRTAQMVEAGAWSWWLPSPNAELYSLTGTGFTERARQQPRYAPEAITRLSLALDLRGADATLDTISLAEAHLASRDLSQALHVTGKAIHLASDSASRRVRKRLDELATPLAPHSRQSGTSQALEQIKVLTTIGQPAAMTTPPG